jgi:hypothetical protein
MKPACGPPARKLSVSFIGFGLWAGAALAMRAATTPMRPAAARVVK